MNMDGVNHQLPKVYLAKVFEDKEANEKPPISLLQSLIDASEKIQANTDTAQLENHIDLEA